MPLRSLLAAAMGLALLCPELARADVVFCQKKLRVRPRVQECRSKETLIAVDPRGLPATPAGLPTPPTCGAAEALSWTGTAFSCVPLAAGGDLPIPPTCAAGEALTWTGAVFACVPLAAGGDLPIPPTCAAGEALTWTGTVFSCVPLVRSPETLTIAAITFLPVAGTQDMERRATSGLGLNPSGSHVANLPLPDGVVLRALRLCARDNDPDPGNNVTVRLKRKHLTGAAFEDAELLASAGSSDGDGASGDLRCFETTAITNPTVDQMGYYYFAELVAPVNTLELAAVQVDY